MLHGFCLLNTEIRMSTSLENVQIPSPFKIYTQNKFRNVVYKTTFWIHIVAKRHTGWRNFSKQSLVLGGAKSSSYLVLHHDLQLLPRLRRCQVNCITYLKKLTRLLSLGSKDRKQRPETRHRFPLQLV